MLGALFQAQAQQPAPGDLVLTINPAQTEISSMCVGSSETTITIKGTYTSVANPRWITNPPIGGIFTLNATQQGSTPDTFSDISIVFETSQFLPGQTTPQPFEITYVVEGFYNSSALPLSNGVYYVDFGVPSNMNNYYSIAGTTTGYDFAVYEKPELEIVAVIDSICNVTTSPYGTLDYNFNITNYPTGTASTFTWYDVRNTPPAAPIVSVSNGTATPTDSTYNHKPTTVRLFDATQKGVENYKLYAEVYGCFSDTLDFRAVVMPTPVVTVAVVTDSICDDPAGVELSYNFNVTRNDGQDVEFRWFQNEATNPIIGIETDDATVLGAVNPMTYNYTPEVHLANPLAKGKETYKLVVEAEGCVSDTVDFKAVVKPTPMVAVAPVADTTCSGGDVEYVFTSTVDDEGLDLTFSFVEKALSDVAFGISTPVNVIAPTGGMMGYDYNYNETVVHAKSGAAPFVPLSGTYTLRAVLDGCETPEDDRVDFTATVIPMPVIVPVAPAALADSINLCPDVLYAGREYGSDVADVIFSITELTGSTEIITLTWDLTGPNLAIVDPFTEPNTTGLVKYDKYQIKVETNYGTFRCADSTTFAITVQPEVEIVSTDNDVQVVCNDGNSVPVTLTTDLVLPNTLDSFRWEILTSYTGGLTTTTGVVTGNVLPALGPLHNPGDDMDSLITIQITPIEAGCDGIPYTIDIHVFPSPKLALLDSIALCDGEISSAIALPATQGNASITYSLEHGVYMSNLFNMNAIISGLPTAVTAFPAITANIALQGINPAIKVEQAFTLVSTMTIPTLASTCVYTQTDVVLVTIYPTATPSLVQNLSTVDIVHGQPWGLRPDSIYPATTPIVTFSSGSSYVTGFYWEKIGGDIVGTELSGTITKDASNEGSIMGGWRTVKNMNPLPVVGHYMLYPILEGTAQCLGASLEFDIVVAPWVIDNELVRVDDIETIEICSSVENPAFAFTGNLPGGDYRWELIADSTKPAGASVTGMPMSGASEQFPAFTYKNTTGWDVEFAYLVTPQYQAQSLVQNPDSAKIFKVIVASEPVMGMFPNVRAEHDSTVVISVDMIVAPYGGDWADITVVQIAGDAVGSFAPPVADDYQLIFTANNTSGLVRTATFLVTPFGFLSDGVTVGCAGEPQEITITVNPKYELPRVDARNFVYFVGDNAPAYTFTGNTNNTFAFAYEPTGSDPVFAGLPTAGSNVIPTFLALTAGVYNYEVTPTLNRDVTVGGPIVGTPVAFTITILARPVVGMSIADQTLCSGTNTTPIGTFTDSCRIELMAGVDVLSILSTFDGRSIAATAVTNTGNTTIFGKYKVTPIAADKVTEGTPVEFTINVKPAPVVNTIPATTVNNGDLVPAIAFSGVADTYTWTASNTAIGIAASGVGTILPFTATNTTSSPISSDVVVTPSYQGCVGTAATVTTITVNPKVIPDHENFQMDPIADQSVCAGTTTTAITFSSTHATVTTLTGVTYKAEHIGGAAILATATATGYAVVNPTANTGSTALVGTYRVTPYWNNFEGKPYEFTITVKPIPVVTPITNVTVYNGDVVGPFTFSGNIPDAEYRWYASNPIGAPATGINTIPPFTAINTTNTAIIGQFDVEVDYQGCAANPYTVMALEITVLPKTIVDEDFLMAPIASQTLCGNSNLTNINLSATHRYPASIGGFVLADVVYEWTMVGKEVFSTPRGTSGTITAGTTVFAGGTLVTSNEVVTATYTVIPVYKNRRGVPTTFSITVYPVPNADTPVAQTVCNGGMTSKVTFSASNNVEPVEFTWNVVTSGGVQTTSQIGLPAGPTKTNVIESQVVTNNTAAPLTDIIQVKARYLHNADNGICEGVASTFTITVNPTPVVTPIANVTVPSGTAVAAQTIAGSTAAANTTYNWTNDNTTIGLNVTAGVDEVPAFTAVNNTQTNQIATITITPSYTNGGITCVGTPIYYTITVLPVPEIIPVDDMVVCEGENVMIPLGAETDNNAYFTWTSDNTATGLSGNTATGIKFISFVATNTTAGPIFTTVTVTPHVVVSGVVADGTPYSFVITVNPITDIITQPAQPAPVCEGETVVLSVVAEGSAVKTYQWFKDGAPLTTADNATALSQTLVISDIRGIDAGNYYVQVTGACGMDESIHVDVEVYLSNLVSQRKIGTLSVNCNVSTNGGYDFVGFQWYRNGTRLVGEVLSNYTTTSINTTDVYYVVLTTSTGKVYRTCGTNLVNPAVVADPIVITIAPNPVSAGGTITATATGMSSTDLASLRYVIVSSTGMAAKSMQGSAVTSIRMPNAVGIYVLRAEYNSGYKTFTIIVK